MIVAAEERERERAKREMAWEKRTNVFIANETSVGKIIFKFKRRRLQLLYINSHSLYKMHDVLYKEKAGTIVKTKAIFCGFELP